MSLPFQTYCITLPEYPDKEEKARAHFSSVGLHDVKFVHGIHAEKFGLATCHPYEVDHPGSGFKMGFKPTGIWLSHWVLWFALNVKFDDYFLILEDDAQFDENWHVRTVNALNILSQHCPDWDMLYIGSCCCKGRVGMPIAGEVFDVKYPACTHAYIVARKALPLLLRTHRKCYAPVDIHMNFHSHPHLKVWTLLPRCVNQFNTDIAP